MSPEGRERALKAARGVAFTHHGQRQLAAAAGDSLSELSAVLLGKRYPNPSTLTRLCVAMSRLRRVRRDEAEQTKSVLNELRRLCELEGLRRFASQAGIDPANLNRLLKGRSKPSLSMLMKLKQALDTY